MELVLIPTTGEYDKHHQSSKLRPIQSHLQLNYFVPFTTEISREFETYFHLCSFETKGLAVASLLLLEYNKEI